MAWDYLDLEMELSLPNIPQSFGGVSGEVYGRF